MLADGYWNWAKSFLVKLLLFWCLPMKCIRPADRSVMLENGGNKLQICFASSGVMQIRKIKASNIIWIRWKIIH